MRRSRWLAFGLVALAFPVLAMPFLYAQGGSPRTSQLEAVVTQLDALGNVVSASKTGLLRVYADGSFSVNDGDQTFSGSSTGSKDFQLSKALQLQDGLVKTPAGLRALPLAVSSVYKLNGSQMAPDQIAGKSGDVEVDITVTNRTLQTQEVTYTDSNTGKQVTKVGDVAIPLQVALSGINLPDANFDSLDTNGVLSRSSDNKGTDVVWSALLAPPLFQGSQTFTLKAKTKDFKMSAPRIATQLSSAATLPPSLKSLIDKAGGDTASIKGYFGTFGAGFGGVQAGAGQMKAGEDQILDGLNNTKFDPSAYAEDNTIATNQPGALEGLHLIYSGIGTAHDFDCPPFDTSYPEKADTYGPNCNEKTKGAKPLSLQAGLALIQSGLSSGDASHPAIIEGVKAITAGVGDETTPNTLLNGLAQVKTGLSSGDPKNPAIIEGLQAILAGLGKTDPAEKSILGGLTAIKAGLGDASNATSIIGGLTAIQAGLGDVTNGTSVIGGLTLIRAGLSSGDPNHPGILEGLEKIAVGIGGTNVPGTLLGGLNQIHGGLAGQIIPGVQSLFSGLHRISGGIGNQKQFDCTGDGVADTYGVSCNEGTAGAKALSVESALAQIHLGLSTGSNATPGLKEGAQLIHDGIGNQQTFDCTGDGLPDTYGVSCNEGTPGAKALTLESGLAQSKVAIAAAKNYYTAADSVSCGCLAHVISTTVTDAGQAATVIAALGGPGGFFAGLFDTLSNGIGNGTEFDATTHQPLTAMATLEAFKAGLSNTDPNHPGIVQGLGAIYNGVGTAGATATEWLCPTPTPAHLCSPSSAEFNPATATPLSLQAIMAAFQGGFGQMFAGETPLIGGLQAIDGGSGALSAGLQQINGGLLGAIIPGIQQIDTGLDSIIPGLQKVKGGNDAILAGLNQIAGGIGDPSNASSIIGGLSLIKGGLSSGDVKNPKILEGLQLILAGVGDKATAASLIGGLTQIRAGLSSGDAKNPAILEGLQQIFAGIGSFNADGSPVKVVTTRVSKEGHTIESGVTFNYNLESVRTGIAKFFDGFGSRNVKGSTLLSGLTQISDGLQQVVDGTKTGVSGADTLQNVVEKTVNSQDLNVALYQAGVQRAKDYKAFVSAPTDASTKVLFLFNLPAIG